MRVEAPRGCAELDGQARFDGRIALDGWLVYANLHNVEFINDMATCHVAVPEGIAPSRSVYTGPVNAESGY